MDWGPLFALQSTIQRLACLSFCAAFFVDEWHTMRRLEYFHFHHQQHPSRKHDFILVFFRRRHRTVIGTLISTGTVIRTATVVEIAIQTAILTATADATVTVIATVSDIVTATTAAITTWIVSVTVTWNVICIGIVFVSATVNATVTASNNATEIDHRKNGSVHGFPQQTLKKQI